MLWLSRRSAPASGELDVRIELRREDRPRFQRTYRVELDGGFRVSIERRTGLFGGRDSTAFLRQRNGRYVMFDVDAIADRIIEPDLCRRVEAVVDRVLALDRQFMAESATSFVDDSGKHWSLGLPPERPKE